MVVQELTYSRNHLILSLFHHDLKKSAARGCEWADTLLRSSSNSTHNCTALIQSSHPRLTRRHYQVLSITAPAHFHPLHTHTTLALPLQLETKHQNEKQRQQEHQLQFQAREDRRLHNFFILSFSIHNIYYSFMNITFLFLFFFSLSLFLLLFALFWYYLVTDFLRILITNSPCLLITFFLLSFLYWILHFRCSSSSLLLRKEFVASQDHLVRLPRPRASLGGEFSSCV